MNDRVRYLHIEVIYSNRSEAQQNNMKLMFSKYGNFTSV